MYLLHGNEQQKTFDFADFYPMEQIAQEHAGLHVITMEEFLNKWHSKGNSRMRRLVSQ